MASYPMPKDPEYIRGVAEAEREFHGLDYATLVEQVVPEFVPEERMTSYDWGRWDWLTDEIARREGRVICWSSESPR
jgi:hypothetical protein